jgi:type II secretory pathway pseudopilin PulG
VSHIASKPRSAPGEAGFSLVELLVTLIVTLAVLGTVGSIAVRSNVIFRQQREHFDRRYNVTSTLDMIGRLLRQAEIVMPDPDGNGQLDSVQIIADWNPRNGNTNDPYENIRFTVAGNTLFKREPADAAPVPFADGISSVTFAYFNPGGGPVLNPLSVTQSQLAFVTVTVLSPAVDGQPGLSISSSASIRRLE